MRSVIVVAFGLLGFLTIDCGSGDGAATTACTTGMGTARTCVETSANMTAVGGVDAAKRDCTNGGGVASDACSHAGADGGCKTTVAAGNVTLSTTYWYYAGNASSEMSACTSGGSVWISP
jgi:hypothetical protein